MGYKCSFMDNVSYTAEDLNQIDVNLMAIDDSEHHTSFESNTIIGVDDMNSITANIIDKGISCGNPVMGATISGDNVIISQGTAFFSDGMTMKIDSNGVSLPYSAGKKYYLYYNKTQNIAEPRCSEEYPDEGESIEYIKIAETSATGVLIDKREFASMKNPSLLPNNYNTISTSLHFDNLPDSRTEEKRIQLGGAYKKMLFKGGYSDYVYIDFSNENNYFYLQDGEKEPLNNLRLSLVNSASVSRSITILGFTIDTNTNELVLTIDVRVGNAYTTEWTSNIYLEVM